MTKPCGSSFASRRTLLAALAAAPIAGVPTLAGVAHPDAELLRLGEENSYREVSGSSPRMCNLYSITCSQVAMRRFFNVARMSRAISWAISSAFRCYVDTLALVLRTAAEGDREFFYDALEIPAAKCPARRFACPSGHPKR
jgi:hypothetical protein